MITKKEYFDLVSKASDFRDTYYNDNETATDAEYDVIVSQIKKYEKENPSDILENSPTQQIGFSVRADAFEKRKHIKKMYSMEDLFPYADPKEWFEWAEKLRADIEYYLEPKYDGASLGLTYIDGKIAYATTRGDGEIGEDISANIPYLNGIPETINQIGTVEIRGEVVILEKDFDEINEWRLTQGKTMFSNRRNAASGGLRSLESKSVSAYKLHFIPYSMGENPFTFKKQTDEVNWFKQSGFEYHLSNDVSLVGTADKVLDMYNAIQDNRNKFQMLLDGVVVKINDKSLQRELGETNHHPRWACALKFRPTEVTATLSDVLVQVGKIGALAPVGVINPPVIIDNVKVSRVTLHNYDFIDQMDLRIGDKISIIRSGDVIPKVMGVFKDRRDGSEMKIERPTSCPACGSTDLDTTQVVIKCGNPTCDAKSKGRIIYAVGRKALNMAALGENTIELLVDRGLIKNIVDLHRLEASDLMRLDGFKEKKVTKILETIKGSIGIEAYRLLNALDIPQVGSTASKKLVETFGLKVFDTVNLLSYEELISTEDIGEETATQFIKFFQKNSQLVDDAVDTYQPTYEEAVSKGDAFAGKTVVITGTLSRPRGDFKEMVEAYGGKVSGSVSKNTSFVLAGEKAGSKAAKAEKLEIPVLSEEEFMALIA